MYSVFWDRWERVKVRRTTSTRDLEEVKYLIELRDKEEVNMLGCSCVGICAPVDIFTYTKAADSSDS